MVTSLIASGAGWFLGAARPDRSPTPPATKLPKATEVLSALVAPARPNESSELWAQLDAAKDPQAFSSILAELDFATLRSLLEMEPRWSQPRWNELRQSVATQLAKIDPEKALLSTHDLPASDRHLVVTAAFEQLSAQLDPIQLSARLASIRDLQTREAAAYGIARGLAKSDPEAALTFAQNHPAGITSAVFGAWANLDVTRAAEVALGFGDPGRRMSAITAVASSWAAKDPTAALAWAQEIDNGALRSRATANVLFNLASQDPARAARALLELDTSHLILTPSTNHHHQHHPTVLHVIHPVLRSFGDDYAAKMDFLLALPPALRNGFFKEQQRHYHPGGGFLGSTVDHLAAQDYLDQFPLGSSAHTLLLRTMLPGIAEQDPEKAIDLLPSIPQETVPFIMPRLFSSWANHDLEAAFDYLAAHPESMQRYGFKPALHELTDSLEKTQALLSQIDALPPSVEIRDSLRTDTVQAMFRHDPATALEAAGADPKLLSDLASQWVRKDPSALDAWLQTRDENQRAAVLAGMVHHDLQSDPSGAAARIATLNGLDLEPATNEEIRTVSGEVARRLAQQDLGAAAEWVSGLQGGVVADAAAAALAESWAAIDANASSAWIRELPAGRVHDSAAAALAKKIAVTDPSSAAQWIGAIGNTGIRDQAISENIGRIGTREPATAATLLPLIESDEIALESGYELVDSWLAEDPIAAREWVDTLAAGNLRDSASFPIIEAEMDTAGLPQAFRLADEFENELFFEEVFDYLAEDDPPGLRAAIEALPAGKRRTELLGRIE